jgi:four helix bundle protein
MTVWRFEDLVVWQRAKELTLAVYTMTKGQQFSRDFGLRDQIQRSSTSVMSNIAEGFERESRAEFARFLMIAKGSCGEVRSQLHLAKDLGYASDEAAILLIEKSVEVTKMIIALRKSLRRSTVDQ